MPWAVKSRPAATRLPSTEARVAGKVLGPSAVPEPAASKTALRSQYSAEVKAIRSRSRSTTRRVATDWTRPAESLGMTFFHSTGETS